MVSTNLAYNGYVGLSTDTKPTASNGARFYEMDTQKQYMFDEEGQAWVEQASTGNGSAGSGSGGGLKVNVNIDTTTGTATLDKSYNEIDKAVKSGKLPFVALDLFNEGSITIGILQGYGEPEENVYIAVFDMGTMNFELMASDPDGVLAYTDPNLATGGGSDDNGGAAQ